MLAGTPCRHMPRLYLVLQFIKLILLNANRKTESGVTSARRNGLRADREFLGYDLPVLQPGCWGSMEKTCFAAWPSSKVLHSILKNVALQFYVYKLQIKKSCTSSAAEQGKLWQGLLFKVCLEGRVSESCAVCVQLPPFQLFSRSIVCYFLILLS